MLSTIFVIINILITAIIHPFHVSVCEIYHNENANSLEISMKIFMDDFELSIQQNGVPEFKLIDEDPEKVEKKHIDNYLKDHFALKIDGRFAELDFLGFEFDDNAILCYMESKKVKKINSIEINNSILTEVYDDQINLTHFQYKEEMKSLKATKENTLGIINTSNW